MKQRIRISIALLIVPCFLLLGARDANAGMSKGAKIGLGVGLIAGGLALGAHVASTFTFGGNSSQDTEAVAALAMVGVGTTLLIIGALEKKKPEEESRKFQKDLAPRNPIEFSFGAAPIKKGWAAGASIRW